jgi:hypothetical protein
MNEVRAAINSQFLFSWVDGVYINEDNCNSTAPIVQEFLLEKGYKSKIYPCLKFKKEFKNNCIHYNYWKESAAACVNKRIVIPPAHDPLKRIITKMILNGE